LDTSILPGELRVDAAEIISGEDFTTTLSGTVTFPIAFLDVAQSVVPGGVATAQLLDARTIVQVRTGATEADADGDAIPGTVLPTDVEALEPGPTSFCEFSLGTCSVTTTQECIDPMIPCPAGETCEGITGENVKPCDQANDNPDGSNPACLPVGPDGPVCQDPIILVAIPTSDDCAPGGVCDGLGKIGPGSQCDLNGFCVTGGLTVALKAVEQTYTAESTGDVLFGWADEGLIGPTLDPVTNIYDLPQADVSAPLEQGISVVAGALIVKVACVMAVDSAGPGGVAACVGGANEGDPCQSPADVGNDICFGGANDGTECAGVSDCPDGECANADCGVGATCEPTDLASLTPDSALIRYVIP